MAGVYVLTPEREQEAMNMAIWDFRPRGDVLTGVAIGVGVLAAPVVVPLAWSVVRPFLKTILKGSFMLYETGRGAFGEAKEEVARKKPEKATAIKVKEAEEQARATEQIDQQLERRTEHVEKLSGKKAPKKPAHEKPRRRVKTGKKKPEKEKEV
jgi:hypothetical protein